MGGGGGGGGFCFACPVSFSSFCSQSKGGGGVGRAHRAPTLDPPLPVNVISLICHTCTLHDNVLLSNAFLTSFD